MGVQGWGLFPHDHVQRRAPQKELWPAGGASVLGLERYCWQFTGPTEMWQVEQHC